MKQPEAAIRIAVAQMEPRIGETAWNLAHSLSLIERAAGHGANLVVLPELCSTGYVFETREEAFALAEEMPAGPTCRAWMAEAAKRGLFLVAGIAERDGDRLFNSAVLIGPEGFIGRYRKLHLWGEETLFFEPGDIGLPVYPTRIGRIGICVCYDGWFPETYRLMALQGADIVCVPTNWVPVHNESKDGLEMSTLLVMAAAHANSIFIAAADRVGVERGQPFLGRSLIVGCDGWPLVGPASATEEAILYADANLSDARRKRNWNEFNQVLRDRRVDVYDEMLGSGAPRGWY